MEFPREYLEFARLCRAGLFYDAHEVLEDLWVCEVPPLKDYYKVLIMCAVAMEHARQGRPTVAARLATTCLRRLQPYGTRYEGMDLEVWRRALVQASGPPTQAPAGGVPCEVREVEPAHAPCFSQKGIPS